MLFGMVFVGSVFGWLYIGGFEGKMVVWKGFMMVFSKNFGGIYDDF